MSYRPENQSLDESIETIILGFALFQKAVKERHKSNDWKDDHLLELDKVSIKMIKIERKLRKLRRETW